MKFIKRGAAIAVASGVAVASLVAPAAAGNASTGLQIDPSNASALAATYLNSQFGGAAHDHLTVTFGGTVYADDGETADAVLSIVASGTEKPDARRAMNWLKSDVANYAGSSPNVYPGSAAKLLLVAAALHASPTSFGGLNLITAITDDEGAGGALTGEYQNPGDTTYSASVLNQSLAVLALANTPASDGPSADAVSFLAGQQCNDGAFQVAARADTGTDCAPTDEDVDTTAYAIQALLAAGHHGGVGAALAWLKANENKNGGWGETVGAKSDSNSTALAIEALIAAHRSDATPMAWLRNQQLACSGGIHKEGAVTLSGHDFTKATAIRATSQAGVALAGKSLSQVDSNGETKSRLGLACPVHHKKK